LEVRPGWALAHRAADRLIVDPRTGGVVAHIVDARYGIQQPPQDEWWIHYTSGLAVHFELIRGDDGVSRMDLSGRVAAVHLTPDGTLRLDSRFGRTFLELDFR
jgi:hypothetical protein